jgi:hypothetical protein
MIGSRPHDQGRLSISMYQVLVKWHMTQILFYMIPSNGIFLSFFFMVRSERPPGCNLLMASMLLALSCLSTLQYIQTQPDTIQPLASSYILKELMVSPFLFLYTFSFLHPAGKNKTWFHPLFITTSLLLLLWINCCKNSTNGNIIIAFILMNGMYLVASLFTITDSLKGKSGEPGEVPVSGYKWIYVLHLLVIGTSAVSIMWYAICPARIACFAQLSKGLVIYYIYLKILDKAVFTGYPHP